MPKPLTSHYYAMGPSSPGGSGVGMTPRTPLTPLPDRESSGEGEGPENVR